MCYDGYYLHFQFAAVCSLKYFLPLQCVTELNVYIILCYCNVLMISGQFCLRLNYREVLLRAVPAFI